jgi:hypothetical protein
MRQVQDFELQGLCYSYTTTTTVTLPRKCLPFHKERNKIKEGIKRNELLTSDIVVNIHSLSQSSYELVACESNML